MARLPVITEEKADEHTKKTLSNFFNHINDTDLDLPTAPEI